MSDAGGADASVSDIELDDEFDDFDPLAESEEEGSGAAPPDAEDDADSDDEDAGADAEEREDGEDGEDAGAGGPPRPAPRRPRKREPAARQEAQTAGTRRIIVVAPAERQSSNAMTLAEVTRAIALRAKQISTHPYAYTDVGDLSDAISIARKELFDRRSPLKLERRMGRSPAGESIIEVWAVREMSYPPLN